MIGLVMLVGPGEGEMALDSLSHVLRLYPHSCVCVRDDVTQDGTFGILQSFARENPGRVCLSRNETQLGYFGCGVSMFRSYEHIARAHLDCEIWIKLDPDACILRPGLDELARTKFADFGPGMLVISPCAARPMTGICSWAERPRRSLYHASRDHFRRLRCGLLDCNPAPCKLPHQARGCCWFR
jgi:hypothetical protein